MKQKSIVFITIFVLVCILIFLVFSQSSEEFYKENDTDVVNEESKAVISINCKTIQSNYERLEEGLKDRDYIPRDGIILPETTVEIHEGDTVLEVLKRVTKKNKIHLEYTQSPNDSYVEGINHIYEFSCGELSGWMFKVNGVFANKGCNSYKVKNGDVIEWVYTCNLGKDIGA